MGFIFLNPVAVKLHTYRVVRQSIECPFYHHCNTTGPQAATAINFNSNDRNLEIYAMPTPTVPLPPSNSSSV